jgi:hypothetical protein
MTPAGKVCIVAIGMFELFNTSLRAEEHLRCWEVRRPSGEPGITCRPLLDPQRPGSSANSVTSVAPATSSPATLPSATLPSASPSPDPPPTVTPHPVRPPATAPIASSSVVTTPTPSPVARPPATPPSATLPAPPPQDPPPTVAAGPPATASTASSPVVTTPAPLPVAPPPVASTIPIEASLASQEAREKVRRQFYNGLINYVRGQDILWGRLKGQNFGAAYRAASRPKALAVCIDWRTSTPSRLDSLGKSKFQFVTGDGECRPTTVKEAVACAIRDCKQYACDDGTTCTLIDVNGSNALSLPASWIRRYSR